MRLRVLLWLAAALLVCIGIGNFIHAGGSWDE